MTPASWLLALAPVALAGVPSEMAPPEVADGAATPADRAADAAADLTDELMALPGSAERITAVKDRADRAIDSGSRRPLLAALVVLTELDKHRVSDEGTVRAYLLAALSVDAAAQNAAIAGARAGGALDGDGRPTVVARIEDSSESLSGPDPAKQGALARYAEAWLAVGKQRIVETPSSPPTTMPDGTVVPDLTLTPSLVTTLWTVYQGGDQVLGSKKFVAVLNAMGVEAKAPFCWGRVSDCFELREAVRLTRAYNDALQRDLGLSADDVTGIEMAGPASVWQPGTEVVMWPSLEQ